MSLMFLILFSKLTKIYAQLPDFVVNICSVFRRWSFTNLPNIIFKYQFMFLIYVSSVTMFYAHLPDFVYYILSNQVATMLRIQIRFNTKLY